MRILNAFSLNMLCLADKVDINVTPISQQMAQDLAAGGLESAVGHPDTAAVFSHELGTHIPSNRVSVELVAGEVVLIGQYKGPRLEAGASELPDGAHIQWVLVAVGANTE